MRPLNEIIVHCSATRPDWWSSKPLAAKVREIKRWHTSAPKSWSDIGYHYIIDRDGRWTTGRPLERVGAHVKGHNTGTIGICLIGGHGSAETDAFYEHFTPEQSDALMEAIADLRAAYPTITRLSGHNEYAAKACPGFNVSEWYNARVTKDPTPEPAKPRRSVVEAIMDALVSMIKGQGK